MPGLVAASPQFESNLMCSAKDKADESFIPVHNMKYVFFCKIVHLNVIVNALVQISTIHYQKK
jgi:hypothetical protein